jgi:hypothetical protein
MRAALSLMSDALTFVQKHPGIICVLIGVAGEIACDWKETTGKRAWLKKLFMVILVGGLSYELVEAVRADRETEELRRANLKLYEQIQPRRITAKQKKQLIEILGTDSKPGVTGVQFIAPDPEAEVFASQIKDVLTACKFEVDEVWGSGVLHLPGGGNSKPTFGLSVRISPDEKFVPPRAQKIFDAFNQVGIPIERYSDGKLWTNHVQVFVGAKPLPP